MVRSSATLAEPKSRDNGRLHRETPMAKPPKPESPGERNQAQNKARAASSSRAWPGGVASDRLRCRP